MGGGGSAGLVLLLAVVVADGTGGWDLCESTGGGMKAAAADDDGPGALSVRGNTESYVLKLSVNSPAVLGSILNFQALLFPLTEHLQERCCCYNWRDDTAEMNQLKTVANYHSSINTTFNSVKPYTYLMNVTVYRKKFLFDQFLATNTVKFTLTGSLNGYLSLKQELSYQRNSSIFITKRLLHIQVHLLDILLNPRYKYKWEINGSTQGTSNNSKFLLYPDNMGLTELGVKVNAKFTLEDEKMHKDGHFKQSIIFKDPIHSVLIDGKTAVPVNEDFNLSVTCQGSTPTEFCWFLRAARSNETVRYSCSNSTLPTGSTFPIRMKLNATGRYLFRGLLINDVSKEDIHYAVYVYNQENVHYLKIFLPYIMMVLSMLAILAFMVSFKKKSRTPVEVADFDFHPQLTRLIHKLRPSIWKRIYYKLHHRLSQIFSRPQQRRRTDKDDVSEISYESLHAQVAGRGRYGSFTSCDLGNALLVGQGWRCESGCTDAGKS